jgi:hypothetical protein
MLRLQPIASFMFSKMANCSALDGSTSM